MAKCIKISSKLHSNCSLNHVSTSNNIFSRPGANLKLFFPFFFGFFFGGDMKFFYMKNKGHVPAMMYLTPEPQI